MNFLLASLLLSTAASAADYCHFRFTEKLAVELTLEDRLGHNAEGFVSWDNENTCQRDGDGNYSCTEMGVGMFQVRLRSLGAGGPGIARFKVASINPVDDLGNRYNRRSAFAKFVTEATFSTQLVPDANVYLHWKGQTYTMTCRPF